MNILITGYKGFIGQNMRNYLHNDRQHVIDGFEITDEIGGFPNVQGYDIVIHLGAISNTLEDDPLIFKSTTISLKTSINI